MAQEGASKVFISTTDGALKPYREAAVQICNQLGLLTLSPDLAVAQQTTVLAEALRAVDQANIFVLLVGPGYGLVPPGESRSYTELEYERAVERGVPVLVFVADPDYPWQGSGTDGGAGAESLARFLARVTSTHLVQRMGGVLDFRASLLTGLSAVESRRSRSDLCYVAMPFGLRTLGLGRTVDFDRVYHEAVSPAARAAGLTPVRADSLVSTSIGDRAVFDAIARAGVMIVDITTGDPNVMYELGLRHAAARWRTLVLSATAVPTPADLSQVDLITYDPPWHGQEQDLAPLRDLLTEALLTEGAVGGSPFLAVTGASPALTSLETPIARRRRDQVETLRSRLVEIRGLLPEDGLPRLKELEHNLADSDIDDDSLRTDLLLAYRDFSAWDEVIRLIDGFPTHLRESTAVVQLGALARNRRGLPGDSESAAAALQQLIARIGPDSETYGLLGRIFKDRYNRSQDPGDLAQAIDAYRQGWLADSQDYYPGINLATLLTAAGGPEAEEELRRLLPQLRAVVDRRIASPRADYWDLATSLEIAVLERDWKRAKDLVAPVRARVASPWMIETTVNNLNILRQLFPEEDARELDRLLRQLTPEVPSA